MKQVQGIVKAKKDGFILKDGSFIEADALIYCTGTYYLLFCYVVFLDV